MPDWLSALKSSLTPLWTWLQSHPFAWVQSHAILSTFIAFALAFGKKVWSKLEPEAVDFIAESAEHRVAVFLTGYRKLYAKHLYYKHRTFDVKGFSTQGKFALELENVYVDPAALGAISQDPLRLPKGRRKILRPQHLRLAQSRPRPSPQFRHRRPSRQRQNHPPQASRPTPRRSQSPYSPHPRIVVPSRPRRRDRCKPGNQTD